MSGRLTDKIVGVRHNLPGSIILVHGVNDVGTSYEAAESGLCAGLAERLHGELTPAHYRMPNQADKDKVEDDPDALFFKRQVTTETHSPVIPFYWGFREIQALAKAGARQKHGQALDRFGNRLDKDFSKGGGPFANATSTLPDMWNRGKSGLRGMLDAIQRDATHPVLGNPGRLYMILAARRLAALITMIRDYHADETVSIVAHSQGCMLSLLAQAFLLDPAMLKVQSNARPADTLVLCNPPYSLVDRMPTGASMAEGFSDGDRAMDGRYGAIESSQTLHARLSTLVNIVHGVQQHKHATPALAELPDTAKHFGVVGAKWEAGADRDNRGKVYLYFSPEDMTVALSNVQGIGWQGVPDYQRGTQIVRGPQMIKSTSYGSFETGKLVDTPTPIVRKPMHELGAGFRQRVFTMKRRPDFHSGAPVLIGTKKSPYDFTLRAPGEDDQAHTAVSDSFASKHGIRGHLPLPGDGPDAATEEEKDRYNLRTINGEALPKAVPASMVEGAQPDAQGRPGASEQVDPIDAAIASTSDYGIDNCWECIGDPTYQTGLSQYDDAMPSPRPDLYAGNVARMDRSKFAIEEALNRDKPSDQRCQVLAVFICMDNGYVPHPIHPPTLLIRRSETGKEARRRWQHASMARSFHGAVYGGRENHRQVTAYDVAIGGGHAPTHPLFYAYLCAVADWRLKRPAYQESVRPGILDWDTFAEKFAAYWKDEPAWRRALIEGSVMYYSTGTLPADLPVLPDGLPSSIILETMNQMGVVKKGQRK